MRSLFVLFVALSTSAFVHAASPLIVAHRGASNDAPENTLPAFELAWQQDADAIEGDFRLTSDGIIVCVHDDDTKRVSGTKKVVKHSSFAELRKLDVGRWKHAKYKGTKIPTLEEVLETVPAGKKIYVEIKCGTEIVPRLLDELAESELEQEQIVIICFDAKVVQVMKAKAPQYKAYWLGGFKKERGKLSPTIEHVLHVLKQTKADGYSSLHKVITEPIIQRILDNGYEYHVWTVDDLKIAQRFKAWGAGSITTNVPAAIKMGLSE
jgi:glycerophosphoryl diester phosphodiesterase